MHSDTQLHPRPARGLRATTLIAVCLAASLGAQALLAVALLHLLQNHDETARTAAQQLSSYRLADELRQTSDDLTRMARSFTVTGKSVYEQRFFDILAIRQGRQARPIAYSGTYWYLMPVGVASSQLGPAISLRTLMQNAGFHADELALLQEAETRSDALTSIEREAFAAMHGKFSDGRGGLTRIAPPDVEFARALLHDDRYENDKAFIMEPIRRFLDLVELRTRADMEALHERQRHELGIVLGAVLASIALGTALALQLRQRVLLPVRAIVHQAELLEDGRYDARSRIGGDNEFSTLSAALDRMAEKCAQHQLQLTQNGSNAATGDLDKRNLLADLSHEIRVPMIDIISATHLALATGMPQKQRDYLTGIRASTNLLLSVIDNILDFTRIESGQLNLDNDPFWLPAVIDSVTGIAAVHAQEKNIRFTLDIAQQVPNALIGDAGRLAQILSKLLDNAVKFTPVEGSISLAIALASKDEEQVYLRFAVRDSGVGLLLNDAQRLFRPSTQIDQPPLRRSGGAGLDLPLCKQLVDMMGGSINVGNGAHGGCDFHFTLPMTQAAGTVADESNWRARNLHVLVVDNRADARQICIELLTTLGCSAVAIDSADAGMRMLKADASLPFDLVLIDWMLSAQDSLITANLVRNCKARPKPPKIALTNAYSSGAMWQPVGKHQFDAVLGKPLTLASLHNGLAAMFGTTDPAAPHAEDQGPQQQSTPSPDGSP